MINVATIMEQVKDWLVDDINLPNFTVVRSEEINEDAGKAATGWIGVYRRSVDYDPRVGRPPNNYDAELIFDLVVQRTAMSSGSDAEDLLEESVKAVLDRVVQIPEPIKHFSNITVEYTYLETDRKTLYFQGALITFTAEVTTEVK